MEQQEIEEVDIKWDNLDMKKFFVFNSSAIFVARGLMYPQQVIKTRLQVQSNFVYKGMIDTFTQILRKEGVGGLYKGFLASSIGFLPAQAVYITTLEFVRAYFPAFGSNPETVKALAAGACASLASSTVNVPVEVISQRLMVQDGSINQYQYKGVTNAFFSILRTEGIRGLYRGYGATILTYTPSNALWWSTYHTTKGKLAPYYTPGNQMVVNGIASTAAATTVAVLTNPLDVSKTILQVTRNDTGKKRNLLSVLLNLIKEEGFRGMTRGIQARLTNMVVVSFILTTIYEEVKRLSVISR